MGFERILTMKASFADVKYAAKKRVTGTPKNCAFLRVVAIDRATRLVFVQIKKDKSAASARSFLDGLHKACRIKITRLNRGLVEAGLFKLSGDRGLLGELKIIVCLRFCWRNMTDGSE